MGWTRKKTKSKSNQKYNNTITKFEGKTFDSKLELYAYQCFKHQLPEFKGEEGVDWQFPIRLQDGFINAHGNKVVKIDLVIDFVIHFKDEVWYVDAKGALTVEANIKLKLLEYKLCQEGKKYRIILLHNESEIIAMANFHKNGKEWPSRKRNSTQAGWSSSQTKTKKAKGKSYHHSKEQEGTSTGDSL